MNLENIDVEMFTESFLWTKRYLKEQLKWLFRDTTLFEPTGVDNIWDVRLDSGRKAVHLPQKGLEKLIDLNFYAEVAELQKVYDNADREWYDGPADGRCAQILLELMYRFENAGEAAVETNVVELMSSLGYSEWNPDLYQIFQDYLEILRALKLVSWEDMEYRPRGHTVYDYRYQKKKITGLAR